MKIKLQKNFMINELNLPDSAVHKEIADTSRWSIYYECVFPYQGKFYKASYSVGATESQDERPWQYEDEVECVEVELKKVEIVKWVEKKEEMQF